jgi:Mg2+ and Co2+ transporter CorA
MQIVEFTADSLRFAETLPAQAPTDGFVWVFLDRETFAAELPTLQEAAQRLGGSRMLDLHCQDLNNDGHPSHYDYTSVYDLIIFRRLATLAEAEAEGGAIANVAPRPGIPAFHRIGSRAVGFAVFDRLLISVHPLSCATARSFIDRFLADAQFNVDANAARSRIPSSPSDLVLRMVNAMVDSYLAVRKDLAAQLGHWQAELLKPQTRFTDWNALMAARSQLHVLEDLCDEQHDAMQEWLDSVREQPVSSFDADPQTAATKRDMLVARARDVIEHIERVMHHARRLEQSAETVVQVHFSAQSNRTNDIMRTLTAITAVFLPLNLITGFFGMNFEVFPLLHKPEALWWTIGAMVSIAALLGLFFWRKRYLARTGR